MAYSTRQQQAIEEALHASPRPLTARQIHQSAAQEVPGLGLATVYRTLKKLEDAQQIRIVELPGVPPHYEETGKHHHFFVCRTCEQLHDLPGCPGNLAQLLPPGFRMDAHEIVLYGQCPDCQS